MIDNDIERAPDEAELTRRMEAEPWSVAAHAGMGDFHSAAGRDDLAVYFYRTALRLAECQDPAVQAQGAVERAREALGRLEAKADGGREARLTQRGLPPAERTSRLRDALDVAAGRRKLYRSEPTAFNLPGLPSIQFFDPAQFDWVAELEAATPRIRAELLGLLGSHADQFRAYVQHNTVAREANQALLGSKDWSVLSLCENGWLASDLVQRCPSTWETTLKAPVPRISGWGPTILFSLLKAGAHIAPHNGMFNTRLICHLPLIVPKGCRFRVGNEVREWEEGKLLIFDDTIEHEAWNDSGEDRVVLIFDIWRPELNEHERYELTALFSD